jgi:hypothetical protein
MRLYEDHEIRSLISFSITMHELGLNREDAIARAKRFASNAGFPVDEKQIAEITRLAYV